MYCIIPCVATTKKMPEIAIPLNEQVSDNDDRDDESQNVFLLQNKKRDDIVINCSAENKSNNENSDSNSKSDQ